MKRTRRLLLLLTAVVVLASAFTLHAAAGPANHPNRLEATFTGPLPGDTGAPFWPHETGVLVGTSETYTDVRDDGSYYDPSLGRRVYPTR